MRRSTATLLFSIFLLAVLVRLIPLTRYLFWGADVGEYFYISRELFNEGLLPSHYRGWGFTYPYFPGMYFLTVGVAFGGLSLGASLSLVVPILAALTVIPVFLIALHLSRDERVGLIAAAIIAVAMPHAYPTSHPIPGALGDLLLVLCLLMVLKMRRDFRWVFLLVPATAALIMTHHLSTYFLMLLATGALALRVVLKSGIDRRVLILEYGYIVGLTLGSISFWALYATPFWEDLVPTVDLIPWWVLIIFFALAVAAIPLLAFMRQRWGWRWVPRFPSYRHSKAMLALCLIFIYSLILYMTFFEVPGTTIRASLIAAILFSPLLILISFSAAGRKLADFLEDGLDVTGWFIALTLSVMVGVTIASKVLLPYRHIEYLMLPLALFAGLGVSHLAASEERGKGRKGVAVMVVVAVLISLCLVSVYPPKEVLAGYEEGVRPESISAALWASRYVNGLMVTDHRASSVLFGFGGVDCTWETTRTVYFSSNFSEVESDLRLIDAPAGEMRGEYVLIDTNILDGVTLDPWEPARPISEAARDKFEDAPFVKIHDSGYARIYLINWELV